MNNAVYGKTIEDIRKRSRVDIVKDQKQAKKLISKPQFKGFQILSDEVTIVQSAKARIVLNKPIFVGFMVLENAKYIMNHFWYDILKEKYAVGLSCFYPTQIPLYTVFTLTMPTAIYMT